MKVTLVILVTLVVFATISCTKTNNVTTTLHDTTTYVQRDTVYVNPPISIVGLWVGKYVNTGEVDSSYYSFDIQATGYLITTSTANNASNATYGPWQLTGKTNFTASVTELISVPNPAKQNIAATYDSTAATLTGTFTVTQGTSKNGTFKLYRVVP